MKTSISIAAPQTTSSGPKCFSGGIVTPRTRREPWTSTWRVSRRYAARKMTIAILPNSAGWKLIGPTLTPRYAPLTCWPMPGTRGSSSSASPANAIV